MSAASPKTQEPSMEEILASIRRIIADDQDGPKAPPAAGPKTEQVPEDDVLDLADIAAPAEPAPSLELEHEDISFSDADAGWGRLEAEPPPQPQPQPAMASEPAERLISRTTDASVGSAFNMLAHTVLTQNARTLEDLVKEMLKPMLRVWLDDNLPILVERLVRAEIERVARGR
jgi:cell pole-organizing protein PopZ